MERRELFKWGLGKVADMAVKDVEQRVNANASRWIRPPYAIAELDFLLKCTRCDDCIDACPHDVLFPLSPKFGIEVASTPAMDLGNKGCHLCADWPCVTACKTGALMRPDPEPAEEETENTPKEPSWPILARALIDTTKCLPYLGPECGACADSCPVPGALNWDGPKPRIDHALCAGCAMCREVCIVEPKAVAIQSLAPEHRAQSSKKKTAQDHTPRS